jgi:transcriptional regulator with XRE-family HTH domain
MNYSTTGNGPYDLGAYLRDARERIHPRTKLLGVCERLPRRIGKRITQEEIAEAAGISRVAYTQLETGARRRPSPELLGRLADALALDPAQRGTLFRLGIPPLAETMPLPDSPPLLDGFSWMRSCTRRLWSVTDEREALAIVAEQITSRFPGSLVSCCFRRDEGGWGLPTFFGDARDTSRMARCSEAVRSFPGGAHGGEELLPHAMLPGDIWTDDLLRSTNFYKRCAQLIASFGFGEWFSVGGRVRSHRDFIAAIAIHRAEQPFKEEEGAVLSAVTHLTSLVLR